jgi:hypothetical protein
VLGLLTGDSSYWARLGNIGQTYGAASALVSVFALTGVAGSIFFQSREAKASRDQALRSLHFDLMKMAMEDPVYAKSWGPFFGDDDFDSQRQHMYINLIIAHWLMMCEFDAMTDVHLRSVAHVLFLGAPGRSFWSGGRELRIKSSGSRSERRFHAVLDQEYEKALRERPLVDTSGQAGKEVVGTRGGGSAPRKLAALSSHAVVAAVAFSLGFSLGLVRRIVKSRPR